MNNADRSQWIDNDEGLYNWFRQWRREQHRSQRSKAAFIRANRDAIDAAISNVVNGRKPAHYLAY